MRASAKLLWPASVKITSLKAGTLYHYRLVRIQLGRHHGWRRSDVQTAGWTIQSTQNPHGSEESDEFTWCVVLVGNRL